MEADEAVTAGKRALPPGPGPSQIFTTLTVVFRTERATTRALSVLR